MTPVMQQTSSDCTRACLASIFDLPLEDVPPLNGFDEEEYHRLKREFLSARGLALIDIPYSAFAQCGLHYMPAAHVCMLSVPSKGMPGRLHHVVGRIDLDHAGGSYQIGVIHDPQGLRPSYPEPVWIGLFLPLNPKA
jgi:hypothetical protein